MQSKIWALLLAVLQMGLAACAHVQAGASNEEAERYIIESSRDWATSVVTGDMAKRKIYFADDFIGTDKRGRRYSKADITRETGPAKHVVSNELESVHVRFYGDAAIAHGSERWEKRDGTKGRWIWTDVWVRRNGSWQMVAAQDAEVLIDE